jgi:O-methyltransferase involved in polyketide biosynthesis
MNESGPLIRNVSDTALWVAVYRARETDRPDAVFRDPYARRLAGARLKRLSFGMRLLSLLPESSGSQGSRPWSGVCLFERV